MGAMYTKCKLPILFFFPDVDAQGLKDAEVCTISVLSRNSRYPLLDLFSAATYFVVNTWPERLAGIGLPCPLVVLIATIVDPGIQL